jgi:hypothetical protein
MDGTWSYLSEKTKMPMMEVNGGGIGRFHLIEDFYPMRQ